MATPATPWQGVLDLGVEVERVVAGIEMDQARPVLQSHLDQSVSMVVRNLAFFNRRRFFA
jgi:hypothetical protein